MTTLVLKVALTPALIGAASLAGRRWGPAVSGWLVGLPLTSAPVALILALEHGAAFAAAAAAGTMAGTISQAAFSLAYAGLAARGPALAAAAGAAAFVLATAALHGLALPPLLLFVVVTGALVATLQLMPGRPPSRPVAPAPPPRWDLPARMIVATGFVLLLTGLAPVLGPRLTGLLSPFPIYAAVLTIFAQRGGGPEAGTGVLRGLLFGLFAFAAFFLVVAVALEPAGLATGFAVATVVALVIQGLTLLVLRRRGGSQGPR